MQETKTRSTKEQWGEQGSQKCRTAGSERHLRPEVLEKWFNQTLSSATWRRGRHRGSPDGSRDPDFDDRLYRCWRLQTCGSCLSSDARCGWCPYSSTCIPLPSTSDMPLRWAPLTPLNHAHICPFDPERFELRTKSFGRESCNVSTTTVLTAVVSFLCGIAAVFVVLGLAWVVVRLFKAGRRARNGIKVLIVESGLPGDSWREERVWVRRGRNWRGRMAVEEADEERRALLGGRA